MIFSILVLFCLLCILGVFLILPGESTLEQRAPFWGATFAHRGLHSTDKLIPENSMPAFTAAIDSYYGIELDVQLSRDGKVVVFHDDDLLRMCGDRAKVDSLPYDELRTFHLLATTQRIPLLQDVLDLVDQRVSLIIELKTCANYKLLCQNTWNVLHTYDGDFCIQSFDPRIVRWFWRHVPGVLRGQLAARPTVLNSGIGGVVGLGFAGFIGRPQFIAYQVGPIPLPTRIAQQFAMKVSWTIRPEHNFSHLQMETDAIIFEFCSPASRYKTFDSEGLEDDIPALLLEPLANEPVDKEKELPPNKQ